MTLIVRPFFILEVAALFILAMNTSTVANLIFQYETRSPFTSLLTIQNQPSSFHLKHESMGWYPINISETKVLGWCVSCYLMFCSQWEWAFCSVKHDSTLKVTHNQRMHDHVRDGTSRKGHIVWLKTKHSYLSSPFKNSISKAFNTWNRLRSRNCALKPRPIVKYTNIHQKLGGWFFIERTAEKVYALVSSPIKFWMDNDLKYKTLYFYLLVTFAAQQLKPTDNFVWSVDIWVCNCSTTLTKVGTLKTFSAWEYVSHPLSSMIKHVGKSFREVG